MLVAPDPVAAEPVLVPAVVEASRLSVHGRLVQDALGEVVPAVEAVGCAVAWVLAVAAEVTALPYSVAAVPVAAMVVVAVVGVAAAVADCSAAQSFAAETAD